MKILKKVFISIAKFFDKILIIPITRLLLFVNRFLSRNSKILEGWLIRTSSLIFISLAVAVATFIVVNNETTALLENSAAVLYDQSVNAIYNEEAFVIEGLPETVDVTLIGKSSELYLAKQVGVEDISVDLSGLGVGSHKVDLQYTRTISSVEYKLNPSTATIIIYPKISELKALDYDLLNQDNLDTKLNIDELLLDRDEVIIKGSEQQLEKVASVKALVDIDDFILEETGTFGLKNIPLIAYDETGTAVDVEIVPNIITASIKISAPQKEVPIRIIPSGELAFGYSISSLVSEKTKVTIYGPQEVLENIDNVDVIIDVDGLSGSKEYNIALEKPLGIKTMNVTNTTINVTVGEESTREISGIKITPVNLTSGLSVQLVKGEPSDITVILNGVSTVVERIEATMINASVDLAGLGVGEHEVDIIVTGTDLKVSYIPQIKKIKVKISG